MFWDSNGRSVAGGPYYGDDEWTVIVVACPVGLRGPGGCWKSHPGCSSEGAAPESVTAYGNASPTWSHDWIPIDHEGINLILRQATRTPHPGTGWSTTSKRRYGHETKPPPTHGNAQFNKVPSPAHAGLVPTPCHRPAPASGLPRARGAGPALGINNSGFPAHVGLARCAGGLSRRVGLVALRWTLAMFSGAS